MTRLNIKIAVYLFISTLAVSGISAAEEIHLFTENFKPFQYIDEEGEIRGFGIDLVRAIFEEAEVGVNDDIRMAIWDNAYNTVLKEDNTALFLTVRNKKRENLFKWVGPLASREMWLYKMRDRDDIAVKSLSDAKKYIVGAYKSAQSDYLVELGFENLDIVLKEELNIKKLLAGRIDLMPSSDILMATKLKDRGIPVEKVEKVIIFDDRYYYYLALNKSVSNAIVLKLQKALDQIKATGLYEQMKGLYLTD